MQIRAHMNILRQVGIAIFAAFLLAGFSNGPGSFKDLGFHLGIYPKQREIKAIEQAVADYNRLSASFYSSGGLQEGLDEIPAGPLMKRRLFQDINVLRNDGMVMVFDKDRFERKDITFLDRETATLEAREIWAIMFQDAETRKPLSTVKASSINVRYLLHKQIHRMAGYVWIVLECDVFPQEEKIPPMSIGPVL